MLKEIKPGTSNIPERFFKSFVSFADISEDEVPFRFDARFFRPFDGLCRFFKSYSLSHIVQYLLTSRLYSKLDEPTPGFLHHS